jgi:hypothetical protein
MNLRRLVLCILIGAGAGIVPARSARAEAQKDVREAVDGFLAHLGDGEWDKVAAGLAAKSIIVVARERDGEWTNTLQSGDEWLAAIKRSASYTKFREPLSNVKITVDSDALAYVRADFQIVRDGKAVARGVDQFTLVHEAGAWKLAAIAYTSTAIK